MTKYIYVGDPNGAPAKGGRISYAHPITGQKVTFGPEPVEAPEWLEPRLKRHNHFKAVAESKKKAAQ